MKASAILSTAIITACFCTTAITSTSVIAKEPTVHEQQSKKTHHKHDNKKQGRHHSKKKFMKRMAKYLALTEQQIVEIKAIKTQLKAEQSPLKAELVEYRDKVKALTDEANFDENGFITLRQQYQETFTQIALNDIISKVAIKALLTDEQREKMATARNKKMAHVKHH